MLALEGQTLCLVSAQAERSHKNPLVCSSAQNYVKPIGCPATCDAEKQHYFTIFSVRTVEKPIPHVQQVSTSYKPQASDTKLVTLNGKTPTDSKVV